MQRKEKDFPILVGGAGPLNGQRWMIDQAVLIGRDPSCEVVIPDRQVSRFHARLMPAPDGVILEDLGSKNGTHWNGQRLSEPVVLQDGDLVQVAVVQHFTFLSADATVPLEPGGMLAGDRPTRLRLESRSRRVWVGKLELLPPLSVPQFLLLQSLYERQGQAVSRQELISTIWSDEDAEGVSDQALDALVRRLRDRLLEVDPQHNYIITIRGHGLRLDNPPL